MNGKSFFLYIEDDILSRQVMQMIMRNTLSDAVLVMFEDSHDLLNQIYALDFFPDVIITDIHVQPHNGFEILSMLRGEPAFSNTKIIALTASVMNEEVEELRSSGFDGAIGKPISVTTFPHLVERVLQGEAVWHIS